MRKILSAYLGAALMIATASLAVAQSSSNSSPNGVNYGIPVVPPTVKHSKMNKKPKVAPSSASSKVNYGIPTEGGTTATAQKKTKGASSRSKINYGIPVDRSPKP